MVSNRFWLCRAISRLCAIMDLGGSVVYGHCFSLQIHSLRRSIPGSVSIPMLPRSSARLQWSTIDRIIPWIRRIHCIAGRCLVEACWEAVCWWLVWCCFECSSSVVHHKQQACQYSIHTIIKYSVNLARKMPLSHETVAYGTLSKRNRLSLLG